MFYNKDAGIGGTGEKSDMLVKVYPQYAKKVFKYGRDHHYVNYTIFEQPLVYRDDYDINKAKETKVNDYGIKAVLIPDDWVYTEKDTRTYIENHLNECTPIDYKEKSYIWDNIGNK